MKKVILSLALALGLASAAQAQVEIGLKVSPSIGTNRFTDSKLIKFSNDGARFHFGGGLVVDYFFGENYAFATGLELVGKGGNIKSTVTIDDPNLGSFSESVTSELGLQYLQVPIGLKLFTNEIATDTRLYFQIGGELGALIGAKIDGKKSDEAGEKYSKRINTAEAGAAVGLGAEMVMGKSTKVFGGLSYHRGLSNIADKDTFFGEGFKDEKFAFQNNLFAFDLGLKF